MSTPPRSVDHVSNDEDFDSVLMADYGSSWDIINQIDQFLNGYSPENPAKSPVNTNEKNELNGSDVPEPNITPNLEVINRTSKSESVEVEYIDKNQAVFELLDDHEEYAVYEHNPNESNWNVFYKTLPPGEHLKCIIKQEPETEDNNGNFDTNHCTENLSQSEHSICAVKQEPGTKNKHGNFIINGVTEILSDENSQDFESGDQESDHNISTSSAEKKKKMDSFSFSFDNVIQDKIGHSNKIKKYTVSSDVRRWVQNHSYDYQNNHREPNWDYKDDSSGQRDILKNNLNNVTQTRIRENSSVSSYREKKFYSKCKSSLATGSRSHQNANKKKTDNFKWPRNGSNKLENNYVRRSDKKLKNTKSSNFNSQPFTFKSSKSGFKRHHKSRRNKYTRPDNSHDSYIEAQKINESSSNVSPMLQSLDHASKNGSLETNETVFGFSSESPSDTKDNHANQIQHTVKDDGLEENETMFTFSQEKLSNTKNGPVLIQHVIRDYLAPVTLVGCTVKFSSRKLANNDIRDELSLTLASYGEIENSWWTPDDMFFVTYTSRKIAQLVFNLYPQDFSNSY